MALMLGALAVSAANARQRVRSGFLEDAKADPPMWGRPVDVLVMRDGALLVSDDYNGIVYRVSYSGK